MLSNRNVDPIVPAANDRFPLDVSKGHVRFGLKATFAKSRERSKITARVGPARYDAASPKQTLIRCCSIIEVLKSAVRDLAPFRCGCANVGSIHSLSHFFLTKRERALPIRVYSIAEAMRTLMEQTVGANSHARSVRRPNCSFVQWSGRQRSGCYEVSGR